MAPWSNSAVSEWPLVSLALGLAGAGAIIVMGTLLARMQWLNFLRYCGEHSIVIYLAFFLPMAATRTLLLKTGLISRHRHDLADRHGRRRRRRDRDLAGRAWRSARNFLFERPAAFWIAPKKAAAALQAAE